VEIVDLQTMGKRKRRAPPAVPPAIRNVRRELQTASQQGRPQVVHVLLLDLTSFSRMPSIIEVYIDCAVVLWTPTAYCVFPAGAAACLGCRSATRRGRRRER